MCAVVELELLHSLTCLLVLVLVLVLVLARLQLPRMQVEPTPLATLMTPPPAVRQMELVRLLLRGLVRVRVRVCTL